MPMLLRQDMEAINKYLMETPIKTAAAKAVQVEWIKFWKETEKSWPFWYSTNEFDQARNIRHNFDSANATTSAQKEAAAYQAAKGLTSEELRGGVRRSTSEGVYITDEEPFIPTRIKVAGFGLLALLGAGYVGVKYLNMTNPVNVLKKTFK